MPLLPRSVTLLVIMKTSFPSAGTKSCMRLKAGNVSLPSGRFPPALIRSRVSSIKVEVLGNVQSAVCSNCFHIFPATFAEFGRLLCWWFVARIRQSSFAETSPSDFRIDVTPNTHEVKTSLRVEFPPALPQPDDDERSLSPLGNPCCPL